MRGFVETMARQRGSNSVFDALGQRYRSWRARHGIAVLERLDDFQLRDIGLTRGDLQRLKQLPLSVDLQWELERLRLLASRRRG